MAEKRDRLAVRDFNVVSEFAKRGSIIVRWVPTKYNFADLLTKPLSRNLFKKLRYLMMGGVPPPDYQ